MVDPLTLLREFSRWLGLVPQLADTFAEKHPELIAPPDDRSPEKAPAEDLDPEVAAEIKAGKL